MRGWDLDVMMRFEARIIGGDTLRTWHNNFAGTGTSQTRKGKKNLK